MAHLIPQEQQEVARFLEAGKPLPDKYRFLLFEVHPTLAAHDNEVDHTFFGEIDVYAEP